MNNTLNGAVSAPTARRDNEDCQASALYGGPTLVHARLATDARTRSRQESA
jgi:hypothetical protein